MRSGGPLHRWGCVCSTPNWSRTSVAHPIRWLAMHAAGSPCHIAPLPALLPLQESSSSEEESSDEESEEPAKPAKPAAKVKAAPAKKAESSSEEESSDEDSDEEEPAKPATVNGKAKVCAATTGPACPGCRCTIRTLLLPLFALHARQARPSARSPSPDTSRRRGRRRRHAPLPLCCSPGCI